MTDLMSLLTAPEQPIERTVVIGGEEVPVYFRRITAGQRRALMEGLKIEQAVGKEGTFEVDLANNEGYRHKLVQFTVVDQDGEPLFKRLSDVEKLKNHRLAPLADMAEEVANEYGEDPGKS